MTAIETLKIAIHSHQVWIDYIKTNPNYEGETHGDSKFHQNRIDDYNAAIADIEAKDELIFAFDATRTPVIDKTIIELRKALAEKVIKCCRTCDSFIAKKLTGDHIVLTANLDNDGHCPFDSSEHTFDDSCDIWNIEALELKK